MIFEHTSYRTYVRAALSESLEKNPRFSLRGFASKIGISPSLLSDVLAGKKSISRDTALTISKNLGLSPKETEYFCLLTDFEKAKTEENKSDIFEKLQSLNGRKEVANLSLDFFKLISDWYHMAILEMVDIKNFNFNAKTVAKRLEITSLVAQTAIDRLERLELLEKNKDGRYRKVMDRVLSASEVPNTALQNFHRQMIEKAAASLATQTPKEKLVGSETMVFDKDQLNAANELMEEFFNKMLQLSSASKKGKDVYHLGIQFFNLTTGEKS
jgi:uncharacterized protein (TIGR02147 family)